MNIFYVDEDPQIAASMLCDKHIVKMILETAQILCSVSWRHGVPAPYKQTHKNHPCVLWAGDTAGNWNWTVNHGLALGREFQLRRGKMHASVEKIVWCRDKGGKPIEGEFQTPKLCMPEQYKTSNPVESYRNYYLNDKASFATWKWGRPAPDWFNNGNT